LRGNADANLRFDDLCALLRHLAFDERIRGGHHIFSRPGIAEILNLQSRGDKAKAYQVKQVRNVLTMYGLADQVPDDAWDAEGDSKESSDDE
jgi:hypothetical protein